MGLILSPSKDEARPAPQHLLNRCSAKLSRADHCWLFGTSDPQHPKIFPSGSCRLAKPRHRQTTVVEDHDRVGPVIFSAPKGPFPDWSSSGIKAD